MELSSWLSVSGILQRERTTWRIRGDKEVTNHISVTERIIRDWSRLTDQSNNCKWDGGFMEWQHTLSHCFVEQNQKQNVKVQWSELRRASGPSERPPACSLSVSMKIKWWSDSYRKTHLMERHYSLSSYIFPVPFVECRWYFWRV